MEKPNITFETERLIIRPIQAKDKKYYMSLRIETSDIRKAYQTMPDFVENEWDRELNSEDDLSFCMFLKPDQIFVGSCSFQDYKTKTIELGIDVVKEYRNHGIATEAIYGLIQTARNLFPGKSVILRTNADNLPCRGLAEKCGASFTGYEPSVAAKAMAKILELSGPEDLSPEKRAENEAFIEANKEGICVYTF